MKVFLRQRKQTSKGRVSLYLEIYKGTSKTSEGKLKPVREYEYLNLYLIDKPTNPFDRTSNKQTKELAESIKAKRELELKNNKHGFNSDFKLNTNFIEYFTSVTNKKETAGNFGNWFSTLKHLKSMTGENITFNDIDSDFGERFKAHLNTVKRSDGKPLSNNSKASYYAKLRACFNEAVKDKIIYGNPASETANYQHEETEREYLTIDEVRALAQIECRYDVLKRAFLFSCVTGLRWSDINKLIWGDVQEVEGDWRITFKQQKTKGLQYLDINQQAKILMGEKGNPEDRVFIGLQYSDYMNTALARWVMKAGITKNITFHCARHTHAVMLLTSGVDIYTVSKILGHKDLKTTQIYAKIIDEKKREAVNKIPQFNF